jgi:cold-inducible RNA-binding protein
MKLFVAGLPYDLDDAELEEIFEKFGTVNSAKVALDKETGKSRGFGFVDMPDRTEAKDAMDSLNEISLGKKPLVIKEAEERSGPPSGNRGGSGGGGGYRGGGGNSGGGGGYRGGGSGGGNDRDRNRY